MGYWLASAFIVLPWIAATMIGFVGGQLIPEPTSLGLDVVFPAAMAGLAVALVTGRRELVAAAAAAVVGVPVAVVAGPSVAVVVAGVLGPLVGMAIPVGSSPPSDEPTRDADDPRIGARP